MNPKWIKIASDVTAALTMLSLIPYELGQVADVFPPELKKWAVILGTGSTVILRVVGRVLPQYVPAVQPPLPAPTPVLQQPFNVLK